MAIAGAGSLVGFTLGLVGGGGSILAVPLIVYLVGVKEPHLAIGTSAFAVAANAFANVINHARHGTVKWKIAGLFAVAMIAAGDPAMARKLAAFRQKQTTLARAMRAPPAA